jgi:heterodisulfide reductase subunit C
MMDLVQKANEQQLQEVLSGEEIWMCGECMSCKTRCPRQNVPGLVIMALRSLSQDSGLFMRSHRGRQQLVIKRTVGDNILKFGYCIYPKEVSPDLHPEHGKIWEWWFKHSEEVYTLFDHEYLKAGPGIFKLLPEETIDELKAIFRITGATSRFDLIEKLMESSSGNPMSNCSDNEMS